MKQKLKYLLLIMIAFCLLLCGCEQDSPVLPSRNSSGRIVYENGDQKIYSMNADGTDQRIEIPGVDNLSQIARWSPDASKMAYWCETNEEQENQRVVLCITDISHVDGDIQQYTRRIFVLTRQQNTMRFTMNISWSPDGRYILADFPFPSISSEYPCLIDIQEETVDCSSTNWLLSGFSVQDLEIFKNDMIDPRGSIQWSTTNQNLLAFMIVGRGLFLADVENKEIRQMSATLTDGMPQIPIPQWSPDGKSIAIVDEVSNQETSDYYIDQHPNIEIVSLENPGEPHVILDGLDLYYENVSELFPVISNFWTVDAPFYTLSIHSWSPDGRYILVTALVHTENKDNGGIFRVDCQTGDVFLLPLPDISTDINVLDWIP